jgi:hypothetical protein
MTRPADPESAIASGPPQLRPRQGGSDDAARADRSKNRRRFDVSGSVRISRPAKRSPESWLDDRAGDPLVRPLRSRGLKQNLPGPRTKRSRPWDGYRRRIAESVWVCPATWSAYTGRSVRSAVGCHGRGHAVPQRDPATGGSASGVGWRRRVRVRRRGFRHCGAQRRLPSVKDLDELGLRLAETVG